MKEWVAGGVPRRISGEEEVDRKPPLRSIRTSWEVEAAERSAVDMTAAKSLRLRGK
jgi:hypothetical protein